MTASKERDSVSVTRALEMALRRVERMTAMVGKLREAMDEEWTPIWSMSGDYQFCVECSRKRVDGHRSLCTRGRFFAALAEERNA